MKLQTILNLQEKVNEAMTILQEEARERLENSEDLNGVTTKNGPLRASTVSFSSIAENNWILDPAYYMKKSQYEAVASRILVSGITAQQFMGRLDDMLKTKRANGVPLNPKTLSILSDIKRSAQE